MRDKVRDDAIGIHKVKKQTAKLSKIYNYSASRNVIIGKVCDEAAPDIDFSKGKSWSEWKVNYLKRHFNLKHHSIALSTLTRSEILKQEEVVRAISPQCQLQKRAKLKKSRQEK